MGIKYDRDTANMVKLTTMSNIPVKNSYGPEDIEDLDYGKDLGDAGQYPFTRGIFPPYTIDQNASDDGSGHDAHGITLCRDVCGCARRCTRPYPGL